MKSETDMPVSLAIFWATVLSGRRAWSEFLSCLNWRLPKCSTADTTRKMAGGRGREGGRDGGERVGRMRGVKGRGGGGKTGREREEERGRGRGGGKE